MSVLSIKRDTCDQELLLVEGSRDDSESKYHSRSTDSSPSASSLHLIHGLYTVFREGIIGLFRIIWWVVRFLGHYVWYHPGNAIFTGFLLVTLAAVSITGSQIHDRMILSQISDDTVNQIIGSSRFTRDFDSTDVASVGSREFLRVGAPDWAQRESVRAVLFHARKEQLSIEHQAVLLAIAEVESGFNPMARAATTSACGVFQFVKATGITFGLKQSDCMNPWLNAQAGVSHYLDNYNRRVKVQVSGLSGAEKVFRLYELSYYLHHDGPNSTNSGNDVKAVILGGTQFLFQVHKVLERESNFQHQAPSFTDRFATNFWQTLDDLAGMFFEKSSTFPGVASQENGRESLG